MADDTKQLQLSTGVTYESWKAWWDYLKSTAANVVSKSSSKPEEVGRKVSSSHNALLSLEDQLLLTLMRLRLGRMKQELADQFGISRSAVSRCLITWINVSALWFAAYLATLESGLKSSPQCAHRPCPVLPEDVLYHGCNGAALWITFLPIWSVSATNLIPHWTGKLGLSAMEHLFLWASYSQRL